MRATFLAVFFLLLFLGARSSIIVSGAQNAPPRTVETQAVRGRYLVEEVAKCSECHTPRDADNLNHTDAQAVVAYLRSLPRPTTR